MEEGNLENKKVVGIEFASSDDPRVSRGDDRMYYQVTYGDGTLGEWERTEVYANEPEKFAALKDRLQKENGLEEAE